MYPVTYSKADFSRIAGVSKAAISKARDAHRLIETAEGMIDDANPVNAGWLAMHKAGLRSATVAPPPPKPPKASALTSPPAPEGEPLRGYGGNLDRSAKIANIELKRRQAERHELAISEKKQELISREIVGRMFSVFDAAMKTNFHDLPRRSAARLHAIAVSGGVQALEAAIEEEITFALSRTVDAAKEYRL